MMSSYVMTKIRFKAMFYACRFTTDNVRRNSSVNIQLRKWGFIDVIGLDEELWKQLDDVRV